MKLFIKSETKLQAQIPAHNALKVPKKVITPLEKYI